MRTHWLIGVAGSALLALSACGVDEPALGAASVDPIEVAAESALPSTPTIAATSLDPVEAPPAAPLSTTTTVAIPSTTLTPRTILTTTTTSLVESILPTAAPPPAANAVEPIVQVGAIEIPKIGVFKAMYEGVSLGVLDAGPGHWPGTAMPGQNGNMVIAGHRMSHDRPFRDVDQLVPGDEVIVFDTAGDRFVYHVTAVEIVYPDAMWILDPTPTPTATLFACHPKGSTRQRIVVHLELAPR